MSLENRSPVSQQASLKARKREERTVLILKAAYEVLVEKGYYETSMDEIAARVGVSKGTLYLHFASKDDLVGALLEQEISNFLKQIDRVVRKDTSVRARLERILLENYRGMQEGQQVLLALRFAGLNQGSVKERLVQQLPTEDLTSRLSALFEEGKRKGELMPALATPMMVTLFFGLMRAYGDEELYVHPFSPEEFAAAAGHVLFQGIAAQPGQLSQTPTAEEKKG